MKDNSNGTLKVKRPNRATLLKNLPPSPNMEWKDYDDHSFCYVADSNNKVLFQGMIKKVFSGYIAYAGTLPKFAYNPAPSNYFMLSYGAGYANLELAKMRIQNYWIRRYQNNYLNQIKREILTHGS